MYVCAPCLESVDHIGTEGVGKVPNLAAGYLVRDRTPHLAQFSQSGLAETTLYPSGVKAEVATALARFEVDARG
jgi:hypothetical protein